MWHMIIIKPDGCYEREEFHVKPDKSDIDYYERFYSGESDYKTRLAIVVNIYESLDE